MYYVTINNLIHRPKVMGTKTAYYTIRLNTVFRLGGDNFGDEGAGGGRGAPVTAEYVLMELLTVFFRLKEY